MTQNKFKYDLLYIYFKIYIIRSFRRENITKLLSIIRVLFLKRFLTINGLIFLYFFSFENVLPVIAINTNLVSDKA